MAQITQKPAQKQRYKQSLTSYKPTDEPFEILRTARKQVAGEVAPPETVTGGGGSASARAGRDGQQKPTPSVLEKKAASHMTAFRQELEEIKELQRKRDEEMRKRWYQQEELKKQREEEAKKAKPLIEPVARVKRGILGGMGKMFGLGRKQRSVELPKTPTN